RGFLGGSCSGWTTTAPHSRSRCTCQVYLSIVDLKADLHHARRVSLSCDLSEIRGAHINGRTSPDDPVQRVEGLPSQFATEALLDADGLRKGHVFVVRRKPPEIVVESRRSKCEGGRQAHELRVDIIVSKRIEIRS